MCGSTNSLFAHLKKDVPGLQLIKCICHSIGKCAEYAHKAIPEDVNYLMRETHNWFAHSAIRLGDFEDYFKTVNNGKAPLKIPRMSDTRWLVWQPVTEVVFSQWPEFKGFFAMKSSADDPKASKLAKLYADTSMYLYLSFLRTCLQDRNNVNLAFQRDDADITRLNSDLRLLVFSIASRILKPHAIPKTDQPGVLRSVKIETLRRNLPVSDNQLPVDRANFGESFRQIITASTLDEQTINTIRRTCGHYIFILCQQLLDRLPPNIDTTEKLRYLTPGRVLSKCARPTFEQLPLERRETGSDLDRLQSQWNSLAQIALCEICPHSVHTENLQKVDIVHFWSCVGKYSNAGGVLCYKELASFALRCFTLPISNAVVERVFTYLAIKTKQRNRLQLEMIKAILRTPVHFNVIGQCCQMFVPTKGMLQRFSSQMYSSLEEPRASTSEVADENDDIDEGLTLFSINDPSCSAAFLPF